CPVVPAPRSPERARDRIGTGPPAPNRTGPDRRVAQRAETDMARYRGRHRKPSNTGRVVARTALAGAVVGTPLLVAPTASAASDSTWDRLAQCESSGNWSINSGNG